MGYNHKHFFWNQSTRHLFESENGSKISRKLGICIIATALIAIAVFIPNLNRHSAQDHHSISQDNARVTGLEKATDAASPASAPEMAATAGAVDANDTTQSAAENAKRGLWSDNACAQPSSQSAQSTQSNTCVIKGNISSSGEKIYHTPGQRYYDVTKIDTSAGERWFCSEAEAQAAGWRKSKV